MKTISKIRLQIIKSKHTGITIHLGGRRIYGVKVHIRPDSELSIQEYHIEVDRIKEALMNAKSWFASIT